MTGLIRKATLLTSCALLVAGAAVAGVPSASTSTVSRTCVISSDQCPGPSGHMGFYMAGTGGPGQGLRATAFTPPDIVTQFTVNLNDLASHPVAGSLVGIDFSGCHELILGNTASQTFVDAGGPMAVSCGGHTITKNSDPSGHAVFQIVGASNPATRLFADPAENSLGCAKVEVGLDPLQLITRLIVATPDLDNSNSGGTVSGADLSVEVGLVSFGTAFNRYIEAGDMNHSGGANIDGADLSTMVDIVSYFASPSKAVLNTSGCTQIGGCCGPFQIP